MLDARVFPRILALLLPFLGATYLLLQNNPLFPLSNTVILINEIDSETPGTDTAEFVELYDGGSGSTNLDGLIIVFFSGHDDRSYRAIDLAGHHTSPEGYFLLANESVPGVDLTFPDNLLQNGADAVALYLGEASDFPNGTAVTTANLQDAIVYGSTSPDDPGLLVLLQPGEPQVDENGLDFAEFHSSQRCPDGTGGARRTTSYIQELPTPRTPNKCPAAADDPPDVVNTSPAPGASSVAPNSSITVTFSEEVTVSSSWYAITCSSSAAHTATVNGNGTTFTLDPTSDFALGDACSVTLFSALISDVDTQDPPDHLPQDYVWSFSIEDPPVAAHVNINEVDADTPGTDTAEFIELHDGGTGTTDLDGLVIVLFNGSDDRSYRAIDLDSQVTDQLGYFVIGGAAVNQVDLIIPDSLIQNGADAIALYQGSEADFPSGTSVTTANLLDAVVYDTADADDSGLLILLNEGQPQVNEDSRFNAANDSSQRCPNGSGGQRNTTTFLQNLPTPGANNKCTYDSPPQISATWPADGQENIGQNISLSVTFNEAVLVNSGAFALTCSTSGAHSLTKSGGPIQFTITPAASLAAGEHCTAQVSAVEISDQDSDDPPDHMAQDYAWSFNVKSLPVATHMVINEVDVDTPGTDTAEFIELFDGGSGNTRLDGLVLVLFNGSDDLSYRSIDLDGFSTSDSGYFTAGGSDVPGVDLLLPSGLIQNGADAVALYAGQGGDFPHGSPVTLSGLLDALVYDTNDADDAGLLILLNSGQLQVNEGARDNQENDSSQRCPNGQGGQRNSSAYHQNPATPGATNDCTIDMPPFVSATSPAAGDEDVRLDSSLKVTFSEDVTVAENWFEIRCSQSLVHGAAQFGGSQQYTLDPQVNFEDGEWCLVTLFASKISDRDGLPQSMVSDYTWTFTTGTPLFGSCGDAAIPIHTVQGSAASSELSGTKGVVVEGIVNAVFQGAEALGGFYLQEENEQQDDHPETSEGIFIHDAGWDIALSDGEIIRAQGTIMEIDGQTSLSELIAMRSCGFAPAPSSTAVTLPLPSLLDWERYEGLVVTLPQDLSVTGTAELGSAGTIDLSLSDRLFVPTESVDPGEPAMALASLNDRSRIKLDDGRAQAAPALPYLGTDNTLRIGDRVGAVTGILAESAGGYRIHPTEPIPILRTNTRPLDPPALPAESLRAALFDVGDYFNGDGQGAGFPGSRGAASVEEFARQRAKIISALFAMNADIIGLLSIENDGYGTESAIQDLVKGLNNVAPAGAAYSFIYPQASQTGGSETAVGLIYRPDKVTPKGPAVILVRPPFDQSSILPLIQSFTAITNGESFTMAITHFHNRDQCPDPGDSNANRQDGQECWNALRVKAAVALAHFLETDPTSSEDPDVLIMGNLNAYTREDPLTALESSAYINLSKRLVNGGYTTVTNGETGSLLHAYASPTLTAQVSAMRQWHINADEPEILNYKISNPPALYAADPYRSSNHDPLLIDISLHPGPYEIDKIYLPIVTSWTP